MPEFILDTSGAVMVPRVAFNARKSGNAPLLWSDLDPFEQGYIEALFFTNEEELTTERAERPWLLKPDCAAAPGFSDLAPETLARIIADCAEFQASDVWRDFDHARATAEEPPTADDDQAGRDFWFTRNGVGVGFWSRDDEVYHAFADDLDKVAEAFGNADAYLGDDGKVYLA